MKSEECPYYDRGFCKLSDWTCTFLHNSQKICKNYMIGFCPKGPECDQAHLKGVVADSEMTLKIIANFPDD